MKQKKIFPFTFIFKLSLTLGLILTLMFSSPDSAWAARSGGRIGGGSFSSPSRSAPSRGGGYSGGGYGGGYRGGYGGGIGFPFLLPFFGYGGGSLFTMLIFFGIIGFIIRSFRNAGFSSNGGGYTNNQMVSIAQVQVGLLASARYLQQELNELALSADTSSPQGRAMVCQEVSLALLRHPEYWVYATAESTQETLDTAEALFNKLSLTERSKFTEETLSNYQNRLLQTAPSDNSSDLAKIKEEKSDYIVVTILVGTTDNLNLPQINDTQDLRRALELIGGISSDRLLTIEVLWTPQAEGDTLSSEEVVSYYPDLRLV